MSRTKGTPTEALHIRITVELKQAIRKEAKRLKLNPSDWVRVTLAERLALDTQSIQAQNEPQ